jgi:hypothetical protein
MRIALCLLSFLCSYVVQIYIIPKVISNASLINNDPVIKFKKIVMQFPIVITILDYFSLTIV